MSDIDRLYQAPLDEFTRARNELAAETKARGDASAAKAIKALVKPSMSAWAVNQLYWKDRKAYDALMKAGERLRDVQQAVLDGRKGDLRKASEARQEALIAALDRATALAAGAGHAESAALRQRLTKTLEALAAYGGAAPGVTPGRLVEDIDPPGFGALAGFAIGATTLPASTKAPAVQKPRPTTATKVVPHNRELARARAELAEAEREARRLRAAADRAAEARRAAADRDTTTKEDVVEAEKALERARDRAKKAAEDLRAADKAALTAEKAAVEAEAAVTAARDAIEELE